MAELVIRGGRIVTPQGDHSLGDAAPGGEWLPRRIPDEVIGGTAY